MNARWASLGYVAVWTVLAINDVGDMPACTMERYSWRMPVAIMAVFALAVALGYCWGRESITYKDHRYE
jgi:hypothetical protein